MLFIVLCGYAIIVGLYCIYMYLHNNIHLYQLILIEISILHEIINVLFYILLIQLFVCTYFCYIQLKVIWVVCMIKCVFLRKAIITFEALFRKLITYTL